MKEFVLLNYTTLTILHLQCWSFNTFICRSSVTKFLVLQWKHRKRSDPWWVQRHEMCWNVFPPPKKTYKHFSGLCLCLLKTEPLFLLFQIIQSMSEVLFFLVMGTQCAFVEYHKNLQIIYIVRWMMLFHYVLLQKHSLFPATHVNYLLVLVHDLLWLCE